MRFALTKIFEKKCVFHLSQNALKRIEMQKGLPCGPTRLLCSLRLRARISLTLLARILRFALTKNFEKKSVSQSTQNSLKRVKMQKKILPLFDPLRASRVAQSLSDVAQ